MAPQIIDLTVASPSSIPTHPHSPNNSASTSSTASKSSPPAAAAAAVVPNYPPPRRGGRAKSNFCYKRFIRTDQVKQQSLTVRPTPMTAAGPSRVRHDSNVHMYSARTLNMLQQGRLSHPVPDDWRTLQRDHDQFVEGFSDCGRGNWKSGMGDRIVMNTMSPEQIRQHSADDFTRVRSPATQATRYVHKEPSSLGHPSNMNDPRAKNPASRNLRRRLTSNPNMVHSESSEGPRLLMRGPKPAPGQMVPVSAIIPVFEAPAAVPVSVSVPNTVSLQCSWRKPPSMFMRRFPADVSVVLPCDGIESSCSSSGSVDPGVGEAEVEKDINLELTLRVEKDLNLELTLG